MHVDWLYCGRVRFKALLWQIVLVRMRLSTSLSMALSLYVWCPPAASLTPNSHPVDSSTLVLFFFLPESNYQKNLVHFWKSIWLHCLSLHICSHSLPFNRSGPELQLCIVDVARSVINPQADQNRLHHEITITICALRNKSCVYNQKCITAISNENCG